MNRILLSVAMMPLLFFSAFASNPPETQPSAPQPEAQQPEQPVPAPQPAAQPAQQQVPTVPTDQSAAQVSPASSAQTPQTPPEEQSLEEFYRNLQATAVVADKVERGIGPCFPVLERITSGTKVTYRGFNDPRLNPTIPSNLYRSDGLFAQVKVVITEEGEARRSYQRLPEPSQMRLVEQYGKCGDNGEKLIPIIVVADIQHCTTQVTYPPDFTTAVKEEFEAVEAEKKANAEYDDDISRLLSKLSKKGNFDKNRDAEGRRNEQMVLALMSQIDALRAQLSSEEKRADEASQALDACTQNEKTVEQFRVEQQKLVDRKNQIERLLQCINGISNVTQMKNAKGEILGNTPEELKGKVESQVNDMSNMGTSSRFQSQFNTKKTQLLADIDAINKIAEKQCADGAAKLKEAEEKVQAGTATKTEQEKKAQDAKESATKIQADIENNEKKVQRICGEYKDEVYQYCNKHLEVVNRIVKKRNLVKKTLEQE